AAAGLARNLLAAAALAGRFAFARFAFALFAVQRFGRVVTDGVGLVLRRVARLRDLVSARFVVAVGGVAVAGVGLALHARLLPLHHVGQLVREQPIALLRPRRELAAVEV